MKCKVMYYIALTTYTVNNMKYELEIYKLNNNKLFLSSDKNKKSKINHIMFNTVIYI